MSNKDYADQYKDVRWQKRRLEVLSENGWQCMRCQKSQSEKGLHVHHIAYRRNAHVWEYSNRELLVLCAPCHKEVEDFAKPAALRLAVMFNAVVVKSVVDKIERVWMDQDLTSRLDDNSTESEIEEVVFSIFRNVEINRLIDNGEFNPPDEIPLNGGSL